jgi:hypothetical protein
MPKTQSVHTVVFLPSVNAAAVTSLREIEFTPPIRASFPFTVTGTEEDTRSTLRAPHHSARLNGSHSRPYGQFRPRLCARSVGEPLLARGQAKSRPHVRCTSVARPPIPPL